MCTRDNADYKRISVPGREYWDERQEVFVSSPPIEIVVEHSLYTISKWESKWKIPFLAPEGKKDEKTEEQILDYVRTMIVDDIDDETYNQIITNPELFSEVQKYISDPMTATWFRKDDHRSKKRNSQQITAELIYCWMIMLNIPFECQHWHIGRLMTLINVCNEENKPKDEKKKAFTSAEAAKRRALNQQRKAKSRSRVR